MISQLKLCSWQLFVHCKRIRYIEGINETRLMIFQLKCTVRLTLFDVHIETLKNMHIWNKTFIWGRWHIHPNWSPKVDWSSSGVPEQTCISSWGPTVKFSEILYLKLNYINKFIILNENNTKVTIAPHSSLHHYFINYALRLFTFIVYIWWQYFIMVHSLLHAT